MYDDPKDFTLITHKVLKFFVRVFAFFPCLLPAALQVVVRRQEGAFGKNALRCLLQFLQLSTYPRSHESLAVIKTMCRVKRFYEAGVAYGSTHARAYTMEFAFTET
jgi:hypothetical protein